MITPTRLKPGDKVGIVAPARWIPEDKYPDIIKLIEQHGFIPVRGNTTRLRHHIFAGTDAERAADLQYMLDNPEIKAIFCLRGGYGTIRIIDHLDFSSFRNNPKWVIGFSDITVLHAAINQLGVESIHGQMPVNFGEQDHAAGTQMVFDALTTGQMKTIIDAEPENIAGKALGIITGGNLSILCSLMGTPLQPDVKNKILFIEDVGEYLYRIDRMVQQLKMAGMFNDLAALVVGHFNRIDDSDPAFGQNYRQIIRDAISGTNYPVAFGFPAGHHYPNNPLIMGRTYKLLVGEKGCQLTSM